METYINDSTFLRRTVLPQLFHQAKLQQRADIFLQKMDEKYGNEATYQTIIAQRLKIAEDAELPDIDHADGLNQVDPETGKREKRRVVGWGFLGFLQWALEALRGIEIGELESEYAMTQAHYKAAKRSGRRKDVERAIEQTYKIESILKYRYDGILWEKDMAAGKIDPRLKRTKEEMDKLEGLQNAIRELIAQIREELGDVLDAGSGGDKKKKEGDGKS